MMQIFIQVVESSLSAAIVVGLVLGVCARERPLKKDKRLLLAAAVLGAVAALVIAVLRRTTAWINMSLCATVGMVIALASGVAFLVSLFAPPFAPPLAPSQKKAKRLLISGAALIAAVFFYTLPSVFLVPAGFLTADESAASTEFLFKCAVYLAGLIFVLLTGYIAGKTAFSHNNAPSGAKPGGRAGVNSVRAGCAVFLIVELLNDAVQILQFLFARRIIPMNRDVFMAVAFLRNNSSLFVFAEIAVLFVFAAVLFILASLEKRPEGNPAVRRKARAVFRGKMRRFALLTVLVSFSVVSLTALKAWTKRTVTLSPPEPYALENGEIRIGLDKVSDGRLHRFAWTADGNIEVRFIIIKKNETSFGVGLDACDICGATGYYERKDEVICMLCDVVMNKNTIGFKGGCNPVPLAYTIQEGSMVVRCEDLNNERSRFQ
jgi:uncharacterized membrane protein